MPHADPPAGAFGGAPYGAAIIVRGMPNPCEGCAEMGVEPHAGAATGAFGGASYGATKRVMGFCQKGPESPCRRSHWGFRWSSLWGQ